jgi:hypothetical protein
MKTAWTEAAWHDYLHWSHADQRMRARIDELIRDINAFRSKASARRSRCDMPCRAGAPAASSASTGWCIASQVSAGSNGSRSRSAGIIIETECMIASVAAQMQPAMHWRWAG